MKKRTLYDEVSYISGGKIIQPKGNNNCPNRLSSKRKKAIRWLKISVCLILIVTIIFCVAENEKKKGSPTIADYSRAQLKAVTTNIINQAVLECLTQSTSYNELVSVHKDDNGKVTLIESNWSYMNLLARQTAVSIEDKLNELANHGIKIPLGNLTGWPLLTGIGPDILITLSPQESVECKFVSEFVSAGINQTLHKIYLDVVTSVDLVMPTYETTIVNSTQILVTEGIIIGEVPQLYLNNAT